ncbi:MAG: hypothetical protein R2911_32075 [Caldilineaceae bacterium]
MENRGQLVIALAQQLGANVEGAANQAEVTPEQLWLYLRDKRLLLFLDNFEHLLAAGLFVAQLLQQAPQVTIVITAREPLGLRAEWLFDLRGLALPAPDDSGEPLAEVLQADAVRLFLQSARRAWSGFAQADHELTAADVTAVAAICRLVNGLPLALELAAGWVQTLTCAEIAAEITRGIDLLATPLRDVPERHRSIRAVIDASWHHLAPANNASCAN